MIAYLGKDMRRTVFRFVFILLTALLAMLSIALSSGRQEQATYIGSESCIDCHDDMMDRISKSGHGRLAGHELDPDKLCESCHGPGSIHGDSEGETPIAHRFTEESAERDVNQTCVRCHVGGETLGWPASAHSTGGVLCIECHKVKEAYKQLGAEQQKTLCASCHPDQDALFDLPSHHPVREYKMACGDCHNPHGAEDFMLEYDNVNDLCFSCHADKEGPFLYEHEPVVENCLACHDAKGAVTNNLLKMNEAALCLRCHAGHEDVHPRLNNPELRAGYMTRCTRCHSQIHGSDLPGFVGPSRFVR